MADLSMSFDPTLVATNSDAASSALAEANAASSKIAAQSSTWETGGGTDFATAAVLGTL
jgi:hypothetical protein